MNPIPALLSTARPMQRLQRLQRLPWPLPAVLAWGSGWAVWMAVGAAAAAPALAFGAGLLASGLLAVQCAGRWRQWIAAAGFPLSSMALGMAGSWPPWAWLLLLLPLLAAYPLRAWRDAPFFPTPAAALAGLDAVITPVPRQVLDAGCGLGHGLAALHRLWPSARLHGIEWSALLAWAAARRCRFARVRRGDMWAASWAGNDVVYVFQRPESMARAMAKAQRELAPGAWLVSLEFAVAGVAPTAMLSAQGAGSTAPGRPLWLYRMPSPAIAAGPARSTASPRRR